MDQVAVVTGASSGIGRASSVALLEEGWRVVVAARRIGPLKELESNYKNCLAVEVDISIKDDIKRLFANTNEAFGRLDLLFNNAGIGAPAMPLEDLEFERWQKVLAVNLTGAFLCTQEAFKAMKSNTPMGGRIINNGSISATTPRPNSAPYTASKHALTGLTKSTSLDGRKYNIACGQIDIGNAATNMTKRMPAGTVQADGSVAKEATMDVENVAKAILYMASLPLDANVQFMTVMATTMPFIGRG